MPDLSFAHHSTISPALREEILDLWCAVNDADGAVGFYPGAPRSAVAAALDTHVQQMADGGAWFYTLRGAHERRPDALLCMAWWVTGTHPLFRHVATIKRLMTLPERQGEGIASRMLDELHTVAQALPGVELLHLQFRAGRGLHRYYARWGYELTARSPRTIKLGEGRYAGSGEMMRTLDGSPLPPYDE